MEWQDLIESGDVSNQAEIARREGITRARVTQILGLLRLGPVIRQRILAMSDTSRRQAVTERALRPVSYLEPAGQRARIEELMSRA